MPCFVIHALDREGHSQTRLDNYPAHRAYLAGAEAQGITIAASGPLMSDDGERMIGSLFIVMAEDIDAVGRFNGQDPFALANLWENVRIHRFDVRRGAVGLQPTTV